MGKTQSDGLSGDMIQILLSDPRQKIKLHNLLYEKTEEVYAGLHDWDAQVAGTGDELAELAKKRISEAESLTVSLQQIFAYGCYFSSTEQNTLWERSLNRLGTMPNANGTTLLLDLQIYPSLLVLYAGGVSALSAKNYGALVKIINAKMRSQAHGIQPIILKANCLMLGHHGNLLLEKDNKKTPLSDHLNELLKNRIPKELIYEEDFDDFFDEWEITIAIVVADILKDRPMGAWAPVGRFSWRGGYANDDVLSRVEAEIDKGSWGPLRAGVCDGSKTKAKAAFSVVKQIAGQMAF